MTVKLLHYTPLEVCDRAISKCWNTACKTGEDMKKRIDRVGNKNKHGSVLEHLTYSFDIDGISRACLQELARHRIVSMSVKSTRYTLKELKEENIQWFDAGGGVTDEAYNLVEKYCVLPPVQNKNYADIEIKITLATALGVIANMKESNDTTKFMLPEAYKTSLVWTINARSLQNFLSLRTDKAALWEIRGLAHAVYAAIPDEHKFIFENYVKEV